MKLKITLVSIGLLLFIKCLSSQDSPYYFENYTDRDYMFISSIKCITQDSLGFMWFGTTEGLIRFDGLKFDLFQNEKDNSKSLISNLIFSVDYDEYSDELILGSGYMNLVRFSLSDLEAENYFVDQSVLDKPIGNTYIRQVLRMDSAVYIIATDDYGLMKFHLPSHRWSLVNDKDKDNEEHWGRDCKCMYRDGDFVWAGFKHGMMKISSDLQYAKWFGLPDSVENSAVVSITDSGEENLLISTEEGLFSFNKLTGTYQLSKMSNPLITGIIKHVVDNQGNIWVATKANGLFFIDRNNSDVTHYKSKENDAHSLIYNVINDIYFSKQQNILWIGTHKGISKVDYNRTKFKAFDVGRLSESNVENLFFLYKDTEQGYWFWDSSGLYHKLAGRDSFEKKTIIGRDNVPVITGAAPLGNGQHLFVSVAGVFQYDSKTNTIQDVGSTLFKGLGTSWFGFYGVVTDEYGIIWMSHRFGVVKYNPKTGESRFFMFPVEYRVGSGVVVTDVAVNNSRKEVWVGTKSGYLIRYNMVTDEFTFFNSSLQIKPELDISVSIMELNFDNKNRLWVASYGSGLLLFDDEKKEYDDQYSVGPLKNAVYSLEKDQDGFFWIATNYGIVCFNPEDGAYEFYNRDEGTFCNEFSEKANYMGIDGEIVLGGVGGFVAFYPERVKGQKYSPHIVIESLSVNDEYGSLNTYYSKLVEGKKQINIKASKHPMQFSVAVLNHSVPEKNVIHWQLEGYNETWFEAPAGEPIVFTNLEPGDYVFHVKVVNTLNGKYGEQDSVHLIILAPFYRQWWFKFALVAFLLCLSYFIYWYRLRVHRRQNLILEKKVDEKTMELQVMNEELKESQEEVIAQNEELERHRNYLEELVDERTRDMQVAMNEAKEANRLKTAFLANLSHEIRTPMHAIIGFSSILVEDELDVETRSNLIKRILENGEELLTLLDDIVDVSIIEAGQEKIVKQSLNLKEFIYSYFNALLFKNKTPQTELLLEMDAELDDYVISTDPNRLKQILNNLLGNAVKFTKEGWVKLYVQKATIKDLPYWIREEIEDKYPEIILFRVKDTGVGISNENLQVIFKPFWKHSDISNDIYPGMGLGLNIAEKFVHLLGGQIWVESVKGVGTTFAFFIPCKS